MKKQMKFSYRIGDIEARYDSDKCGSRPEIVQWLEQNDGTPYCIVVAYWEQDEEGWELCFVGSRPFELDEDGAFWSIARSVDRLLNVSWEA